MRKHSRILQGGKTERLNMDDFANIAANGIGRRQELLHKNEPPVTKKNGIKAEENTENRNKDNT